MTLIEVAVFAVIAPFVEPNATEVAPERFVPVIVSAVPPVAGAWLGLIEVIAGLFGASYV